MTAATPLSILVSRMVMPVIFLFHGHLNLKHESRDVRSVDLLMLRVGLSIVIYSMFLWQVKQTNDKLVPGGRIGVHGPRTEIHS